MLIFTDIETVPPRHSTHDEMSLCEVCKEEDYRKLALQAEYGRILCIGVITEVDNEIVHQGVFGRDKKSMKFHLDEKKTLKQFWNYMKRFRSGRDLFVGHNLLDFDMRFIQKRSVIQKVEPSVNISFRRFYVQDIFDTMWMWSNWQHRISLNDLCKTLGVKSPKDAGIDGSDVYELYLQGRHSEIAE